MGFRILHTEWSSGWGGQEMRIVAESAALRSRGHMVAIGCQPNSQILRRASAEGLPTIPMRLRKGFDPAGIAQCLRAIRTHGIELVHTHSSPDAWTCGIAARLAGVRVVRSRHLSTPVKPQWPTRLVYGRLADRVIASGQAIKDHLVRAASLDLERIVSIPAGVDVQRFAPRADGPDVRRELGLSATDFVVGIIAVLRSWKGHAVLLDAIRRLLDQGVTARLLIVGAGPQESSLKKRISELDLSGCVQMLGHRDDVPRLIGAMDCVVLPATKNEATSQALPQALAMKVPVIASAVGGLPEVVSDRQTGLLVPPGDAEALCDALRWVHEHPAQARQLAERGYARVQEKFTFERMIERTESVYGELLRERPRLDTSANLSRKPARPHVHEVRVDGRLSNRSGPLMESQQVGLFPFHSKRMPCGWCRVDARLVGGNDGLKVYLSGRYLRKSGESKRFLYFLGKANSTGSVKALIKFPHRLESVTVEVATNDSAVNLAEVEFCPIGRVTTALSLLGLHAGRLARNPFQALHMAAGLLRSFYWNGFPALKAILREFARSSMRGGDYHYWVVRFDQLLASDRRRLKDRANALQYKPLISLLMPVYDTDGTRLRPAIDSVLRQIYSHWELCIAVDGPTVPYARPLLEELKSADSRIKVVYREKADSISALSNSALELATGEFTALFEHADVLADHALVVVADELNRHRATNLLYTDEDKITEKDERYEPNFKPDFSPDLLRSCNLFAHLTVIRSDLIRAVGQYRDEFDGSHNYDLALRVVDRIDEKSIRHLPHILYHNRHIRSWQATYPAERPHAHGATRKALQEHLTRRGIDADVIEGLGNYPRVKYRLPNPVPLVSIVICTRDRVGLLRKCVDGLLNKTNYPNIEVLIVDNGSVEMSTLRYFESIRADMRVKVIRHDAPFNFSELNNLGVRNARGEVLVLLNNDTEVINPEWLNEMVSHALRPEVGMVGAKLYYPDRRIQHAGVILGIGGVAGHPYRFFPANSFGIVGRAIQTQNLSVVTAACAVMRKSVFDEMGGFNEEQLAIALNDVDLCLRVREKGYLIVWTPYAELVHHESVSRGSDLDPENIGRYRRERQYMFERWGQVLREDPYYNPNLTVKREDLSVELPPRFKGWWKMADDSQPA